MRKWIQLLCLPILVSSVSFLKGQTNTTSASVLLEQKETLAIVAITSNDLSRDQLDQFVGQLASDLSELQKFNLMSKDQVSRIFEEAKVNAGDCYSVHCLSEAAKILGVQRVLQGNVTRRGKLYRGFVKIVDPTTTAITFSKNWEYSGEFQGFLATSRTVSDNIGGRQPVEPKERWYYAAAAILTLGITVYLINWSLGVGTDRGVNFENPEGGQGPPPPSN